MNNQEIPYSEDDLSAKTVTIVIATHNGSRTLEKTLESFRKLHVSELNYDIVAVDNASTDQTNKILRDFTKLLPLTVIYEPKRGKNTALNRVISDISSDLIVFTDDDVVPKSDWLVAMQKAAEQEKDYAIFGGRVIPRWPSPPPPWLLSEISLPVVFTVTPPHLTEGPIDSRWVFGPNMCVRREVFRSGLRFDEAVGPTHGEYIMGSETDFTARAQKRGFKCWHVSNAVVEHLIREEQLDLNWIVRRAQRFGRGLAYADRHGILEPKVRRLLGMPLGFINRYSKGVMLSQWHWLNRDERMWFRNAYAANQNYGFLCESVRNLRRKISASFKRL